MTYLYSYLTKTTTDLREEFSMVLRNFWSDYNVLIWNMGRPFTSFVGSELLDFIKNTDLVVSFLKENYAETETLHDLCNALLVWTKITPFLVIVQIEDVNIYQEKLNSFKTNLTRFYEIGRRSFLNKNADRPGQDETFCMHTL